MKTEAFRAKPSQAEKAGPGSSQVGVKREFGQGLGEWLVHQHQDFSKAEHRGEPDAGELCTLNAVGMQSRHNRRSGLIVHGGDSAAALEAQARDLNITTTCLLPSAN